ncbi:MAG: hypothetical protein HGA44_13280 [Cellulomonadaceae bacterium]|nr:hypothetical protein [Cellulomonadaceae bacterium]
MIRGRAIRSRHVAALVAGVVAVIGGAGAAAALARHGALLVHQCLPGDGTAGFLGLRLALLRVDSACPGATLAVGGDTRQVAGVVVLVALPVLLVHLVALAAGVGVLARLRQLVRSVATVLRGAVRTRPAAALVMVRRVRAAVESAHPTPRGRVSVESPWRRGPPLVATA